MTGLNKVREQMAIKKEIEEIYRKIDQILELIRQTMEKLERRTKEEAKPTRIKAKKKKVDILSLKRKGKKTEIEISCSQEMNEILDSLP